MFSSQTTRRRALSSLAMTLLAAAAFACGGSDDSTGPSGSGGDSTPPPSSDATLTLQNHSSNGTVMFFRSRPCGSTSWGSDMLGTSLLFGGEEQSWTVTPACYDFRATPAEEGLDYLYFTNVQIGAGENKVLEITAFPAE